MKPIRVNKECLICAGVFTDDGRDNPDLSQPLRDQRVCPECYRRFRLYVLLTSTEAKPAVLSTQAEAKRHRGKLAKKNLALLKEIETGEFKKRIDQSRTRCASVREYQRIHGENTAPVGDQYGS